MPRKFHATKISYLKVFKILFMTADNSLIAEQKGGGSPELASENYSVKIDNLETRKNVLVIPIYEKR